MAQDVASLADVMKEVWTSDRLEKQFYDENPLLDRIERTGRFTIGEEALVPIHKGRSGGYTSALAAGSTSLNDGDKQRVDRASYKLVYHWFQVKLETAVINEADGSDHSVGDGVELEVTGAVADMRKQIMRQVVSNGDGIVCNLGTTTASTTVNLGTLGFDALARGWAYEGLKVDIGSAASEGSVVADHFVKKVVEDETTPTIEVSATNGGAAVSVTTATTDRLSVANARAGTTTIRETNGLRGIAGSTTSSVGGLDPDTAGEEFWKPAEVDTTTTVLSLDLLLKMQRKIHQKTGKKGSYFATSLKQEANYYSLLQNQVRFPTDSVSAGGVEGNKWAGLTVDGIPDIPDRELYMLTLSDFLIITGRKIPKPRWVSDIEGAGGRLRWEQGKTSFVDALVYPLQLGIKRRNSHAAATALNG